MKRRTVVLAGLAAAVAVAAVAATTAAASSQHPAASASAANRLIKCGKTRTIGFMAPATGPAASLGAQQIHWANFYVADYNRTHKKTKIKLNLQDTMLGAPTGTAEALKGAQALVSNPSVLALAGPAGSNEIISVTKTLRDGGLAWISGSSTKTTLTTDGTRTGFMFRTVPPDAVQGAGVANFILSRLKLKRVYIIDDEEAYSTGLADTVESVLKAHGVTVTRDGVSQQQSDFSSLIAKIPRSTQLVYLPWQLPPKGQAFGQQMQSAGKGGITLMGSDGLYDDAFAGVGKNVYDSAFPLDPKSKIIARFRRAHGGNGEYFGAPTYAAVQVAATAIDKACAKGSATRASVRAWIRRTNIPKKKSLIGVALRYNANGDLSTLHSFGFYKSNGNTFIPF